MTDIDSFDRAVAKVVQLTEQARDFGAKFEIGYVKFRSDFRLRVELYLQQDRRRRIEDRLTGPDIQTCNCAEIHGLK